MRLDGAEPEAPALSSGVGRALHSPPAQSVGPQRDGPERFPVPFGHPIALSVAGWGAHPQGRPQLATLARARTMSAALGALGAASFPMGSPSTAGTGTQPTPVRHNHGTERLTAPSPHRPALPTTAAGQDAVGTRPGGHTRAGPDPGLRHPLLSQQGGVWYAPARPHSPNWSQLLQRQRAARQEARRDRHRCSAPITTQHPKSKEPPPAPNSPMPQPSQPAASVVPTPLRGHRLSRPRAARGAGMDASLQCGFRTPPRAPHAALGTGNRPGGSGRWELSGSAGVARLEPPRRWGRPGGARQPGWGRGDQGVGQKHSPRAAADPRGWGTAMAPSAAHHPVAQHQRAPNGTQCPIPKTCRWLKSIGAMQHPATAQYYRGIECWDSPPWLRGHRSLGVKMVPKHLTQSWTSTEWAGWHQDGTGAALALKCHLQARNGAS